MRKCAKCGAEAEPGFDVCWSCGAPLDGTAGPEPGAEAITTAPAARPPRPARCVRFKIFRSSLRSWEDLFGEAADYATRLGPDLLISISHSEDSHAGVVTVWFWGE